MPFIDIKTSAKLTESSKKKLYAECGELISIFPGKSETWLMVNLSDGCEMAFKGDSDTPCAIIEVKIFGKAQSTYYDKFTEKMTETFAALSNVSPDRVYIRYDECSLWGWNGENF